MKTTIQSILVTAALVMASASGIAAAEEVAAKSGATSVAEMMQRKQEHQLRDQLATEGQWDQIQQIDDKQMTRLREQQEKRYAKLNESLSGRHSVAGPGNETLVQECERESLHLDKLKSAAIR